MINVLHIGLSYKCNMRCKHCFVSKQKDLIDTNQIKKIIDNLYDKGLVNIIYTYGEPLLAKNINEITLYAKEKGLSQTLMTNGYFFKKETIDMLNRNNVKNIMISLDSIDKDKHNENRGVFNAYDKAIEAVKLIPKNCFNVGFAVSIDNSNIDELDEIVILAKKLNVKKISFLTKRINGKLVIFDDIKKLEDFLEKSLSCDIRIVFHDYRLIKKIKELYQSKKIDLNQYERLISMNSCHQNYTLSIAPNGDVFGCNLIGNKIGNVIDDELDNILEKKNEKKCINCYSKF